MDNKETHFTHFTLVFSLRKYRNLYEQDVDFRTNIRLICALAFVPPHDIFRAFDTLCLHCGGEGANDQQILEYFESTSIGVVRGGVRGRPLFRHSSWNVYDRVMNDLPRTINAVEGWHNAFQRSVGKCHANIWTFISCLQKEHSTMHLRIAQNLAVVPATPSERAYRQLNQQTKVIVQDYPNRNIINYS